MIDRRLRLSLVAPAVIMFLIAAGALFAALFGSPPKPDMALWRQSVATIEHGERTPTRAEVVKRLTAAGNLVEAQWGYQESLQQGFAILGALLVAGGLLQLSSAYRVLRAARARATIHSDPSTACASPSSQASSAA